MTKATGPRAHLRAFQRRLTREGIDAALISDRHSTHWLTGFRGTASTLIVFPRTATFITDFRYIDAARRNLRGLRVLEQRVPAGKQIRELLEERGVRRLGLESTITHAEWLTARRHRPRGAQVADVSPLLRDLRAVKDAAEIRTVRRAVRLTDEIFADVLDWLQRRLRNRTVTERDVSLWLKREFETRGGEGPSFAPIVAAGANSANPHAVPGKRAIREGHFLLFDFGLVLDGYCSDMTRTVIVGQPTPKHERIYDIVAEAQSAAIDAVRAGVAAKEIDAAARRLIRAEGFGKAFGHGTGHGVGLEIHEAPRVAGPSKDTLEEGMVITVEPGIYLPRWGGVRIEDMVVVREKRAEVLTRSPKTLLSL